jgi:hypothetical protein
MRSASDNSTECSGVEKEKKHTISGKNCLHFVVKVLILSTWDSLFGGLEYFDKKIKKSP